MSLMAPALDRVAGALRWSLPTQSDEANRKLRSFAVMAYDDDAKVTKLPRDHFRFDNGWA
jgi:hypothetical protein